MSGVLFLMVTIDIDLNFVAVWLLMLLWEQCQLDRRTPQCVIWHLDLDVEMKLTLDAASHLRSFVDEHEVAWLSSIVRSAICRSSSSTGETVLCNAGCPGTIRRSTHLPASSAVTGVTIEIPEWKPQGIL